MIFDLQQGWLCHTYLHITLSVFKVRLVYNIGLSFLSCFIIAGLFNAKYKTLLISDHITTSIFRQCVIICTLNFWQALIIRLATNFQPFFTVYNLLRFLCYGMYFFFFLVNFFFYFQIIKIKCQLLKS